MTNEVDTALDALKEVIKTISVTESPGNRVWVQPTDYASIRTDTFPFCIVAKMNGEPGQWYAESWGVGKHKWTALVAVYVAPGPIVVTSTDEPTIRGLRYASEWYKAMSDILFANLTLGGTVDIIGDGEGGIIFDYVTDNILWDGQQYFGHLFSIPVYQDVTQVFDS